jgi:branched-chain amino acid transport system ATP-binding protein
MTLRVSQLHAGYGRIEVCREISLTVENSEFLVVLGANGAGKSTLLGAIAGSVSHRGEIALGEVALQALNARERARRGLALVPEGRRNLFAPLTVRENLQLGVRLLAQAERIQMYREVMDKFPILSARESQPAGLLSGGEQQMLAIAVAIARRPSVLLLDEPSQGLGPLILESLIEQIGALRAMGLSVVLAEQNYRFAARLADRYVVLSSGEITGNGAGAELNDPDRIAAALV